MQVVWMIFFYNCRIGFFFNVRQRVKNCNFFKVTCFLFVSANGLEFLLAKYLNIKKFHLINCTGLLKMSLFL